MALRRNIDDRQTTMTEADADLFVDPLTAIVWTAMSEPLHHGMNDALMIPSAPVSID
jgi:hypothetical protein